MSIRVGKKIKEKRLQFGFTLDFIGEVLNCSHQLIAHYESGFCEMPIYRLNEFAQLCDLPVDWFFMDENDILVWVTYL